MGPTKYSRLRDPLKAAKIECCIVGGESSDDKLLARYFSLEDAVHILEEATAAGAHPCLKQLGTRWAIAGNNYNVRSYDGGSYPTPIMAVIKTCGQNPFGRTRNVRRF